MRQPTSLEGEGFPGAGTQAHRRIPNNLRLNPGSSLQEKESRNARALDRKTFHSIRDSVSVAQTHGGCVGSVGCFCLFWGRGFGVDPSGDCLALAFIF